MPNDITVNYVPIFVDQQSYGTPEGQSRAESAGDFVIMDHRVNQMIQITVSNMRMDDTRSVAEQIEERLNDVYGRSIADRLDYMVTGDPSAFGGIGASDRAAELATQIIRDRSPWTVISNINSSGQEHPSWLPEGYHAQGAAYLAQGRYANIETERESGDLRQPTYTVLSNEASPDGNARISYAMPDQRLVYEIPVSQLSQAEAQNIKALMEANHPAALDFQSALNSITGGKTINNLSAGDIETVSPRHTTGLINNLLQAANVDEVQSQAIGPGYLRPAIPGVDR